MNEKSFSRRDLMKALGGAATMLPVLPSLLPAAASAQSMRAPLRIVFLMNKNGQIEDNFFPALPLTQQGPEVWGAPLAGAPGDLSPIFAPAFSALKGKINIVRGADLTSPVVDHCRSAFLCGVQPNRIPGNAATVSEGNNPKLGCSIDWLIENSSAFYPTAPAVRAMRFSINPARGLSFSNVNGTIQALPYIGTDSGLFNNVFGVPAMPGGPSVDLTQRKGQLIDTSLERLALLSANRRLGGLDRQRLQQHVDQLGVLKSGLQVPMTPPPTACSTTAPAFWSAGLPLRRRYENVDDTIVAAFTCDRSRLACVYLEDFDDQNTDYNYFHGLSHADPAVDLVAKTRSANANRWIGDRVAHLLTRLDQTTDVDGRPMLENTLVVWGNEISNWIHRGESVPTMIAGGAGGLLKTGWYLDYRQRPFRTIANRTDYPAVGRPYLQLLCTVMALAGLTPADWSAYGTGGKFGEYAFPAAYAGQYSQFDATRNDPLPFIRVGT